jgi:hypothetical protein
MFFGVIKHIYDALLCWEVYFWIMSVFRPTFPRQSTREIVLATDEYLFAKTHDISVRGLISTICAVVLSNCVYTLFILTRFILQKHPEYFFFNVVYVRQSACD